MEQTRIKRISYEDRPSYFNRVYELAQGNVAEWAFYWSNADLAAATLEELHLVLDINDGEAALIACPYFSNGNRGVRILWSAGNSIVSHVPAIVKELEAFARECGATRIEMSGRKAWQRVLEAQGYNLQCVTMHKDI